MGETVHFLDATKADRLHALYLTALATGMRRGELAGLRRSDIDLDPGKLTIASARVVVGYAVIETGPKTAKGRRTIAIAPAVVDSLMSHGRRQLEEHMGWGPGWTDTGLVFTREDGTGLHPQYVTWVFQRAAKQAGLPVLPLHALRHGHATAGLRQGSTSSRCHGVSGTAVWPSRVTSTATSSRNSTAMPPTAPQTCYSPPRERSD